jgi:transcriptional regulator with XRE-family HTH domain
MAAPTTYLGTRLRELRRAAEVTRAELARRAGLSGQAIRDIESGARPDPRWSSVQALAQALGVSTDVFCESPKS